MREDFEKLETRLREVEDLRNAAAVLAWDQATFMPSGGASARGRQIALLEKTAQERFVDKEVGRLLDTLQPWAESQEYESYEASLVRLCLRLYDKEKRVPPSFTAEISEHQARGFAKWIKARPENDFAAVREHLERSVELSRQYASFFPEKAHVADALIDDSDYGMTVAEIRPLFRELRSRLVPIVEAIGGCEEPATDFLYREYPEAEQLAFGMEAARRFGYDLDRGRQDMAPHPFMIKFSLGDVRITTRCVKANLNEALFSTLHETGHALYEQGVAGRLEGTPLAHGTSSGVHESQSRLWENQVGRSLEFWQWAFPLLQERFPEQLKGISVGAFYRAINICRRSLIRTDADEVTYNLHVMIRFDLELALLEGSLGVADLPEAWHARYEADLGLRADDDRDGVLQDVHWYGGLVGGAFQGYTLGNILSAAFFAAARRAHPGIPMQIANGELGDLRAWLTENVYRFGRQLTPQEVVARATGGDMSVDPYVEYLETKFGQLYAL